MRSRIAPAAGLLLLGGLIGYMFHGTGHRVAVSSAGGHEFRINQPTAANPDLRVTRTFQVLRTTEPDGETTDYRAGGEAHNSSRWWVVTVPVPGGSRSYYVTPD